MRNIGRSSSVSPLALIGAGRLPSFDHFGRKPQVIARSSPPWSPSTITGIGRPGPTLNKGSSGKGVTGGRLSTISANP